MVTRFQARDDTRDFFRARNGYGETSADLTVERAFVAAADFSERLFENQFAYCDTEKGLQGLLGGKGVYTIINAGWIGQGAVTWATASMSWDNYLGAYKIVDEDTAGFWVAKSVGRFANDQTPASNDPADAEKLQKLRADLCTRLDKVFELK